VSRAERARPGAKVARCISRWRRRARLQGLEVIREIRDNERGGKAKIVILGTAPLPVRPCERQHRLTRPPPGGCRPGLGGSPQTTTTTPASSSRSSAARARSPRRRTTTRPGRRRRPRSSSCTAYAPAAARAPASVCLPDSPSPASRPHRLACRAARRSRMPAARSRSPRPARRRCARRCWTATTPLCWTRRSSSLSGSARRPPRTRRTRPGTLRTYALPAARVEADAGGGA